MYNLLVVEDSKPILRHIVRQIEASGYNVHIKTAFDGDLAYDMLTTYRPDVLFTDIQLPTMDGLSLIKLAKERFPSLCCVIISGYGDFSYAHQALMLQVDEYMLKPIMPEELKRVLAKVIGKVDRLARKRTENNIRALLSSKSDIRPSDLLGLPTNYMLVLIRLGWHFDPVKRISCAELDEILDKEDGILVADTQLNNEKMLLVDLQHFTMEQARALAKKTFDHLSVSCIPLNAICSERLSCAGKLRVQYEELSSRLTNLIRFDTSALFDETSEQVYDRNNLQNDLQAFRHRMEIIIKSRSSNDYCSEVHYNICLWKQRQYSVPIIRRFLHIMFDILLLSAASSDELSQPEDVSRTINHIIIESNNYEELEDKLCSYSSLLSSAKDDKLGISEEIAQRIEQYLKSKIYVNITLQDISDDFNLSASYICRLIKAYFNDTPIAFHRRLRIEEAKRLIQEYKDLKVRDISEALGFSDQYYFCKVFKKQYGKTPTDFRSDTLGRQESNDTSIGSTED